MQKYLKDMQEHSSKLIELWDSPDEMPRPTSTWPLDELENKQDIDKEYTEKKEMLLQEAIEDGEGDAGDQQFAQSKKQKSIAVRVGEENLDTVEAQKGRFVENCQAIAEQNDTKNEEKLHESAECSRMASKRQMASANRLSKPKQREPTSQMELGERTIDHATKKATVNKKAKLFKQQNSANRLSQPKQIAMVKPISVEEPFVIVDVEKNKPMNDRCELLKQQASSSNRLCRQKQRISQIAFEQRSIVDDQVEKNKRINKQYKLTAQQSASASRLSQPRKNRY